MTAEHLESGTCPLCGRPLYGWITRPAVDGDRVLARCESCGVALEPDREVDLLAEWEAICRPGPDGERAIEVPNRASLQAMLGAEGWAGLDLAAGRLLLTPRSLELLADRNGHHLAPIGYPLLGPGQAWMWQTLLNGLTFHPNFAREVRAGRLRPATARGRLAFAADLVVTVLGAPLVALASFPLELGAALARRGGRLVTAARPSAPTSPGARPA